MDEATIRDRLAAAGPLRIRRMFGGQGIYAGDLIFAIAVREELFLKVDGATEALFRSAGSTPFTYEANGKQAVMSYWRLPEAAYDDPDLAARWTLTGLEAARRSAAAKPARRRSSKR